PPPSDPCAAVELSVETEPDEPDQTRRTGPDRPATTTDTFGFFRSPPVAAAAVLFDRRVLVVRNSAVVAVIKCGGNGCEIEFAVVAD
ncbi:hypothetical protein PIB30_100590, partial [Stylosanthes scabra]|nr:hypothetical protein [Stylosanthes scabra]